jgi:hypothetical protein
VIGSHLCSFTLDGEKHLGIAASRIMPWVKLHWRVEPAQFATKNQGRYNASAAGTQAPDLPTTP